MLSDTSISSTSSTSSSSNNVNNHSFTNDDNKYRESYKINTKNYSNDETLPSQISSSESDSSLASKCSSRKESLKNFIVENIENYEEVDDNIIKIREKISCKKQSSEDETSRESNLGDRVLKLLKRNTKKPEIKQNSVLRKTRNIQPEKIEELFLNVTGDDIVSAIYHRNVTAIIYSYIADKLDKNYRDKNNNNYLHIGVEVDDILTMKTLLLLIEDSIELLIEVNNNEKCPIDLVKSDGMRNILSEFASERKPPSEMLPDQIFRIAMIGEMASKKIENITKDSKIMISLDGGGIRGLCTIQVLMAIQKKMDNNLWENVDWVAGTSTGGILALLLSLNYSLHGVRKAYLKLKNEVFVDRFKPYSSEKIENLLIKLLGKDETMDKIKNKKVAVTTVKCKDNFKRFNFKMFRNYHLSEDKNNNKNINRTKYYNEDYGYDNPSHNYIWKAARCTSAAPHYFHTFGNYVDGGLISNNPSIDLLTDYFKYHHLEALNKDGKITTKPVDDICCFISLGTGSKQVGMEKVVENELKDVSTNEKMILSRFVTITKQIMSIIFKVLDSDGLPVERTASWCNSIGVPFFRLQPHLPEEVELDEKKNPVIINMLWDVENYIKNFQYYEIEALARYLDTIIDARKLCKQEDTINNQ
ncbi:85/88 kDa calcium-independent phospholipase A2 [Strongyloides ratti]|uniref:85/88 kDa calcium-independent phospholipase A2 n=1 Tax=Strongyloides ratti TaxID=34506 RepID=A0A090LL03_STRRB|nr:85/88 kDa calcium-independent phospholipase A2 [Strongyloides ratti]CEF70509.1 85/88 kDa calcium-independent phospholipase A2 [Strongyloides ratti]